jgi:hypothetical protein
VQRAVRARRPPRPSPCLSVCLSHRRASSDCAHRLGFSLPCLGFVQPCSAANSGFIPGPASLIFLETIEQRALILIFFQLKKHCVIKLFLCLQVFFDRVKEHTDVGAAVGDAVVAFENIAVLNPRGRFDVEMYGSFMKLVGQARPEPRPPFSPSLRLFRSEWLFFAPRHQAVT